MVPVECVARGYLTGSGLAEYKRDPYGLRPRAPRGPRRRLRAARARSSPRPPRPPSASTTRTSRYEEVARQVGAETAAQLRQTTLAVYGRARDIARERGIILADTKFEFGFDGDGTLVLADEVLTPDSSRFWPADQWEPGRAQPSYDKQFVRDWLTSAGLRLGPRRASSRRPPLPQEVVDATRAKYIEAYERLTGTDLVVDGRDTKKAPVRGPGASSLRADDAGSNCATSTLARWCSTN